MGSPITQSAPVASGSQYSVSDGGTAVVVAVVVCSVGAAAVVVEVVDVMPEQRTGHAAQHSSSVA